MSFLTLFEFHSFQNLLGDSPLSSNHIVMLKKSLSGSLCPECQKIIC